MPLKKLVNKLAGKKTTNKKPAKKKSTVSKKKATKAFDPARIQNGVRQYGQDYRTIMIHTEITDFDTAHKTALKKLGYEE